MTLVFIEPISAPIASQGLKKNEYVSKSITIPDATVSDLEKVIKDVWSDIKNLHFEKLKERDKDVCAKCDFDTICWRQR